MRPTHSRGIAASIATTMLLLGGIGSIGGNGATVTIADEYAHATQAGASADDSAAPIPVVDGNRLVDQRTGERFVPRGVDWPSFEYACRQGWAYSAPIREQDAAAFEAWHVSIVRPPLNQDCWLGLEGAPVSDPWHTRTVAGYRDRVETWVDRLNAHGIVVLLDLHWSAPDGEQADAQRAMADAQSVDFWTSVGARFADHPSVMFDLFNEPYSQGDRYPLDWDCWRTAAASSPPATTAPSTARTAPTKRPG